MKNLNKYIPYAISISLLFILLHTCNREAKEKNLSEERYALMRNMYDSNAETLKRDTTAKGEAITSQELLILTEKQAKENALIENERLKKIKSEVIVVTKTIIKKVYINIVDTFDIVDGDTVNSRLFNTSSEWYGLSGKVLPSSVLIDSMYFNNRLTVTIGYEKQGFMKPDKPVVDIINKNPHSKVNEVYNLSIEKPKKMWYQTKGAMFGAGIVGGLYLSTKL